MLPYNLPPRLAVACLAFWVWSLGFTSIFPKKCLLLPSSHSNYGMNFTNWFSGSLYVLSVKMSPRFPQLLIFFSFLPFFFFFFNNLFHSPHVPFCLLSHNSQHFDFSRVFVFPWWREYYHLFLWLTSFEWYKLHTDFLIFQHTFLPWVLFIQAKCILNPGDW